MVVHIVLFKFNEENKEANIQKAKELIEALPSKITQIKKMEVGVNFDTAPRAMDLSLYSQFQTKEDLDIYATHSEHIKVIDFIKTVTQYTKVSDYII